MLLNEINALLSAAAGMAAAARQGGSRRKEREINQTRNEKAVSESNSGIRNKSAYMDRMKARKMQLLNLESTAETNDP